MEIDKKEEEKNISLICICLHGQNKNLFSLSLEKINIEHSKQ